MHFAHVVDRLASLEAKPEHTARLLRHWLQAIPLTQGRRALEHYLPAAVRAALPGLMAEWSGLVRLHTRAPGADGSERLLFALQDGQSVESVLLPQRSKAWGLCVSTQVGCAVGCRFCMTGQGGLIRQLTDMEILAQVAHARQLRSVNKVVFMGMGEPSHNLTAVLRAIERLGTEGGIGHKNLVFSTVGDERAFEALAQARVKPALALSLHSTDAAQRAGLLPNAPGLTPERLVELGEAYARATGYPVQYQWTLLEGVNDNQEDAIVRLLQGRYGILNLIPFNPVEGLPYRRPVMEQAQELVRRLHRRGILTKLRDSAGQDVEGGCGQLRARIQQERPVRIQRRPSNVCSSEP